MKFKVCDCGKKPVHGYFMVDENKVEEAIPFPISSQFMGFIILDVLRFNGLITKEEAVALEAEIRNSSLSYELTDGDLEWLSAGIRFMVGLYYEEEYIRHKQSIAMQN